MLSTSRGNDVGEKINAWNRHIAVDTLGLLLIVLVTAATPATEERLPAYQEVMVRRTMIRLTSPTPHHEC